MGDEWPELRESERHRQMRLNPNVTAGTVVRVILLFAWYTGLLFLATELHRPVLALGLMVGGLSARIAWARWRGRATPPADPV